MSKDIKTYNWGTDLIKLKSNPGKKLMQGKPTELHLKTDGTLDNGPSLAIVFEDVNGNKILGQVSIQMLSEALNELGYNIIKDGG